MKAETKQRIIWFLRPFKSRNDLIEKQDGALKMLDNAYNILKSELAGVQKMWSENYKLVEENRLGKGRFLEIFKNHMDRVVEIKEDDVKK